MNPKIKGTICGIIAAVAYGTNPLGALNLYKEGVNVDSVVFYRYSIATIILAILLIMQKKSLRATPHQILICAFLGVLFAASSLTLFFSFHFMDAGIASTLLFVYPVMVAVIMAVFFKEKTTIVTAISILFALAGIALLYQGDNGATLNMTGVLLVMLSSLTYAMYIIAINKFRIDMSPMLMTFYVMIFGVIVIVLHSFSAPENHLQMLTSASSWGWAVMLALLPTTISLVTMAVAIKNIGSTPAAIMGALEPVTAVIIGIFVFHESFSMRLSIGILLILTAVLLIIGGRRLHPRKIFNLLYFKHKLRQQKIQ